MLGLGVGYFATGPGTAEADFQAITAFYVATDFLHSRASMALGFATASLNHGAIETGLRQASGLCNNFPGGGGIGPSFARECGARCWGISVAEAKARQATRQPPSGESGKGSPQWRACIFGFLEAH